MVVVFVFVLGGLAGALLAGVEVLLRALKGLLELCALIPGVVAADVGLGPMERGGVAKVDDDVSGAVMPVSYCSDQRYRVEETEWTGKRGWGLIKPMEGKCKNRQVTGGLEQHQTR